MPNKNKHNIRNKLGFLSLSIAIALLLVSNSTLTTANTGNIDIIDKVDRVLDASTFTISSGAIIKLADIKVPQQGQLGFNESFSYLKHTVEGKQVLLDVDSNNKTVETNLFYSVAYYDYNESHYINVNRWLVEKNSAIIDNRANDFNPYSWSTYTPKNIAIEGYSDCDTFENYPYI